jgi:chromosome segregation and condensation protein ScpB
MSELEIIEAALFAAGRAVSLEKLAKITGKPKKNRSCGSTGTHGGLLFKKVRP